MALTLLALKVEHLQNARLFADRLDALSCWPRHAAVAEIGVAYGSYSAQILTQTKPRLFDAYDLFRLHEIEYLWGRPTKEIFGGRTQIEHYRHRFQSEIAAGTLRTFEGDSSTELLKRDPATYDVIYIDGDHGEVGVSKDAAAAERALKHDGLLVFNDYVYYDRTGRPYGVIPVVNDMCVSHGWSVVYVALQKNMFCDIAITRLR